MRPTSAPLTLFALFLTLTLLPTATALPASAAQHQLVLSPDETEITIFLEATGHDVHGTFFLQEGTVTFDPETGKAEGLITVDATRGETGNTKRDRKMHGTVLESDKFPLIQFRPERVNGTVAARGDSHLELSGKLSIHGSEHDVTLAADVHREGDQLRAEAELPVPFVNWGMKDPSIFILSVAKVVQVHLSAAGTLTELVSSSVEPDAEPTAEPTAAANAAGGVHN